MPTRRTIDKEQIFYPGKKAIIAEIGIDEYSIDKDLRDLDKVMIKPTYANLEKAFWNDSISTSFTDITAAVIKGDGPRFRCEKSQDALDIIKRWNRKINVRRETVEDFMRDTWFDAVVYSKFFYRVDDRTPDYEDVDVQRLDPKTIQTIIDPVMGYRKFVQHTTNFSYHRTKRSFYRNKSQDLNSRWLTSSKLSTPGEITYGTENEVARPVGEIKITLQDEPNVIVYGSFFKKPPIANALHFIVYKRWILWYMRKYSQKHWAPFVILSVGDPKSNTYPSDIHKMQDALNNGKRFIRQITNFGGVAIPGEMELKTLETQTARSSEIYVLYVRELDKQIMYAIFGSMGQREASGNELATSRILERGWLRFIKGIRRQYELILTNFYAYCLLPYHGINDIEPQDIEVDWSPLREETTEELMRSIKIGAEIGLWKDVNEMRKAAQPIFPFLDEIPENKNKKVEIIGPSNNNQAKPEERLMEYYRQKKDK